MTLHILAPLTHPVAEVARRICTEETPCLSCWTIAIEADAEFADEYGLGEHPEVDPDYIDEVAVEVALAATRRVRLTMAEWTEAIRRLRRMHPSITAAEIVKHFRLVELPDAPASIFAAPVAGAAVAA